eukprot:Nk52_evm67s2192 gene=Nk52_evmTU67s2192
MYSEGLGIFEGSHWLMLLGAVAVCGFLYASYEYYRNNQWADTLAFLTKSNGSKKRSVMILIAHPDDECMFFAPVIQQLATDCNMHLLCMSTGNYDGLGKIRKKELLASCNELGIKISKVGIVDSEKVFPDGPVEWVPENVGETVAGFVCRWGIDTLITFDSYGVSGHVNHRSCFYGMEWLLGVEGEVKNRDALALLRSVLYLESVTIFRKYIGVWDMILCVAQLWISGKEGCRVISAGGLQGMLRGWRAMKCHSSQLVWFRRLYLLFSRYMFANTLVVRRNRLHGGG